MGGEVVPVLGREEVPSGRPYRLFWASADVGLADGSVRFPLLPSERGQDLSPSLRKGGMLGDAK